jgi:geranylgeranyl pyrophosphate synthase
MSQKKQGELVVAELARRSERGLKLAKKVLVAEKMEHPKLREALEHYLNTWRDFTHPGLFSMACEAAGGAPSDSESAQAAIAMMAAAFDIHDDIIDQSKTKHGIPTVYGKYGTEIAILLGNAFLIEGFKLIVDASDALPKERGKRALDVYKTLLFEVGNAHALEVGVKGKRNVAPSEYFKIIEMKAAGIEADMHLGALFGAKNEAEIEALARLGRIIGVLVTLREEFVDVFDLEELRQRLPLQDLPLPIRFAMQDKNIKKAIQSILEKPKITKKDVENLVDITLESEGGKKLKGKMQNLMTEGLSLASILPRFHGMLQVFLHSMLEDL